MTTRSERIEAAAKALVDYGIGAPGTRSLPTSPEMVMGLFADLRAALATESAPTERFRLEGKGVIDTEGGLSLCTGCGKLPPHAGCKAICAMCAPPNGACYCAGCTMAGKGAPPPPDPTPVAADDAPKVVCGGCGNTVGLVRDASGWWRLPSHDGGECFSSGTFDYTGHDQPGGRLPPHDPPGRAFDCDTCLHKEALDDLPPCRDCWRPGGPDGRNTNWEPRPVAPSSDAMGRGEGEACGCICHDKAYGCGAAVDDHGECCGPVLASPSGEGAP